MTSTAVINAQSYGTSTNKGNSLFTPNATTLQTGTTAFVVSVKLANSATSQDIDKNQKVRVWYTTTTYTVTAAEAPLTLARTARYVDCWPRDGVSKESITDSSLEPVTGANFMCWVDAPTMSAAGSLTVTLVELP